MAEPNANELTSEKVMDYLKSHNDVLQQVGNTLLGVRENFNVVGQGAATFQEQVKDVTDQLTKSNGALQALGNSLGIKFDTSILQSFNLILGNQMRAADNAIKLEHGFLSLAAATGSLDQAYKSAGPNLENIGGVINTQIKYLLNTSEITKTNIIDTEKYYNALGKIPNAFTQIISSGDKSSGSLNMLSAVMRLSHGASRDTSEIISDLSTMYSNLGLSGEPALTFTARFSEISNKFGIQLGAVKESLMGVTSAYKGYVDAGEASARLTQGSTAIMNNYMQALKDTGMTGEQASSLLGSAFNNIRNMSDAQKSFLSSQMGGPGGLQGSFKMDMMIREGKSDEIFESIQKDLSNRFGKFVSQKEASESQEAASELKKQMAFLRQGPYGSIVTDDRQAIRMIEAFKAKQEGGVSTEKLSTDILSDTLKKGSKIEDQVNILSDIRDILRKTELAGSVKALESVKNYTSLGVGEVSDDLRRNAIKAQQESSRVVESQINIVKGEKTDVPEIDVAAGFTRAFERFGLMKGQLLEEGIKTLKNGGADQKDVEMFTQEYNKGNNQIIQKFMEIFSQRQARSQDESTVVVPKESSYRLLNAGNEAMKKESDEIRKTPPNSAVNAKPVVDVSESSRKMPVQQMQQPILNAKLNVELNTKCSVCGHELETSHTAVHAVAPGSIAQ